MSTEHSESNRAVSMANGQSPVKASMPVDTPVKAEEAERDKLLKARESFSGRLLTDAQFDEAIAITQILEREIFKTGSLKDKLQDYAYAMARSENMDARKLEGSLRDLFRERTGRTMNQMLEMLKSGEEKISDQQKDMVQLATHEIEVQMSKGDKIAFHRACAEQAQTLADELGVTDAHGKRLMASTFEAEQGDNGLSFRDWGEKLDAQYYRPQIEAEKQARAQAKQEAGHSGGIARPSRRR